MKNERKIYSRSLLLLILFSTSLISLKTLNHVNIKDIKISGTNLFSQNDLVNNLSVKFPTRLIFINTKFLEKELKQNLSLKHVSISRQIFPFGLKIEVSTRIPVAYGERILKNEKILGYIDADGIFINKQNVDEKNLKKLTIRVFGWEEKFKKILSEILIAQEIYEFDLLKITFSPNGFLSLEEKDLKTIFLGFNSNLINYQLQIINKLKNEFVKNNISKKIDKIDLTDPYKPKIKVFKP